MKTYNLIARFFLLFFIATALLSCDKDEEVIDPPRLPDGEAMDSRFSENLQKELQKFVVDITDGGSMTGEKGTTINIYAKSLVDKDGNEVTGDVDIELIEIYKKASMLLNNKPTIGRTSAGEIATLVSGGEFFINAKQDGEQLFLADQQSFGLVSPTDNPDHAMQIFTNENKDCLEPDCDVVWEEEKGRMEIGDNAAGGMAYYGFINQFGWTNIDKWYSDPRPKTTIFVDVPDGYDNTNCAVYLSYDGEPAALAPFDMYDDQTGLFTEHYGLIPIGLEVHFIMVSVVNDEWNYTVQAATITEDHVEVLGPPSPVTESDLTDIINDLP